MWYPLRERERGRKDESKGRVERRIEEDRKDVLTC